MAASSDFFEAPKPHSMVKIDIVTKYFSAWATIMLRLHRPQSLTYLDLFSGPGRYEDGTAATPLRIMDQVMKNSELQERLRIYFYESNAAYHASLKNEVQNHDVYSRLRWKPEIAREEVRSGLVPQLPIDDCTFSFIDPWGYKGISLSLLASVLEKWGCDCLFYLSVSGIRRNIERLDQVEELEGLLGELGVRGLQNHLRGSKSRTPFHEAVVRELKLVISRGQPNYLLPFGVQFEKHKQVSHCLVFLSKHFLGFKIMKEIMAQYSLVDSDGFPAFLYDDGTQIPIPFEGHMQSFATTLHRTLMGRTMTVKGVLDFCHEHGYVCIDKNIKDALCLLESELRVDIEDPHGKLRRGKQLPERLIVRFLES